MINESLVPSRNLVATLVLLLAVYLVVSARGSPPPVVPASAPATQFSAERALAKLKLLLGDQAPHPVGSAEDARLRQRIVAELQGLGLNPRVQAAFACSAAVRCATVQNVVARIEGTSPGKAVLVAAHYDSVPAGPGAADDGASVAAVLEIARALKSGSPLKHPVILLIDEGEEIGLLGAQAFADQDPWRREVGVVINLEARGTSGPSRMFQTSGPNGWLVRAMSSLRRPITSSLFPAVYQRLPNDTDLTVFLRRGIPGVNFAFIGGAGRYHTPFDDVTHLDPRSLQHQGENALAMVRAFGNADLDAPPPPGDVVFFDLFGLRILSWPGRWNTPLALLSLALLAGCLVLCAAAQWTPRGTIATFFVTTLAVVGAGGLSFGLTVLLMSQHDYASPWIANPGPALGACWLLSFAFEALLARTLRSFQPNATWLGVWMWWATMGCITAQLLPGASYLFIAPALVAAMCGLVFLARGRPTGGVATALPALAAGLVWFPVAQAWYPALGVPLLVGLGLCGALVASTVVPLFAVVPPRFQKVGVAILWVAAAVMALVGLRTPQHSAAEPAPMTFLFHEDSTTEKSEWLTSTDVHALPSVIRSSFRAPPVQRFPWSRTRFLAREATPAGLPPPTVTVLSDVTTGATRQLHLRLVSARHAPVLTIAFNGKTDLRSIDVSGIPVHPRARSSGGWSVIQIWATPAAGIDLSVTVDAGAHPEAIVGDASFGLPASGARLLRVREGHGMPKQSGDETVVTRQFRW